jgi:uroporphyrinogen decarboxylase
MNSRERALAPFKGSNMDRLPMWYGGDKLTTKQLVDYVGAKSEDEALYDVIGIDYKTLSPKYKGRSLKTYEDGSRETEWGITRGGYYGGQALQHPLSEAETVEDIEKYNFPNPNDWDVVITEEEANNAKDYCVIGGAWAPFFNDTADLMGMEQFFINMYTNPEVAVALIEKCFDFYYELSRRSFEKNKGKIDFLFFGNDFGSQKSLLISPEMWRKFFKRKLAKMADLAHKHGAVACLHSCGAIKEIIPDLIDIGIDGLNPIQVSASNMNPEVLKREYGKHIVFFGGIDENEILSHASEQKVREETKRIIDILGSDGRYIVAASHDYLLPEVPAANIFAMYDEAKKYSKGKY